MRFWDTSALAPQFIAEANSVRVKLWRSEDADIVVWIMTRVELCATIARRARERPDQNALWSNALQNVLRSWLLWQEVNDVAGVRERAEELVRRHPLRAADALQLGAATVAADGDPASLGFVTFDLRLAEAARSEGFPVLGVTA